MDKRCKDCEYKVYYEKESSPYRLNNTEVNVFSKLFKDYIKDENKLEKIVETFRSYLSNASKSPANAEGKCSDEDTLYRVMKERIEDKKESEAVKRFKEKGRISMNWKEEFIKLLEEGYSKTIDDYADEHNLPISAVWQCFADYRNECLIKQSIGTPCEGCKYVTQIDGFTPPCYECCRNKSDFYEKR